MSIVDNIEKAIRETDPAINFLVENFPITNFNDLAPAILTIKSNRRFAHVFAYPLSVYRVRNKVSLFPISFGDIPNLSFETYRASIRLKVNGEYSSKKLDLDSNLKDRFKKRNDQSMGYHYDFGSIEDPFGGKFKIELALFDSPSNFELTPLSGLAPTYPQFQAIRWLFKQYNNGKLKVSEEVDLEDKWVKVFENS